jgi:hypothetical protein
MNGSAILLAWSGAAFDNSRIVSFMPIRMVRDASIGGELGDGLAVKLADPGTVREGAGEPQALATRPMTSAPPIQRGQGARSCIGQPLASPSLQGTGTRVEQFSARPAPQCSHDGMFWRKSGLMTRSTSD